MWINYSDSEVDVYHPICGEALKQSLIKLGLSNKYHVIHHFQTGTIEPDFVIENMADHKILCVFEVKRTKSDVQSTRYQYQAQSYVLNIGSRMETPFYVLTNLESSYLFRYDSSRTRPFQQLIKPGLIKTGDFGKYGSKQLFLLDLVGTFCGILKKIINNVNDYLITLDGFSAKMETLLSTDKEWKSALAMFLYEYIRGSFESISRRELRDIRAYSDDIESICFEGHKIDFEGIFGFDIQHYLSKYSVDSRLLSNLFIFAKENIYGDVIADILHSIVCKGREHEGLVSTDIEISKYVALLAKIAYSNMLNKNDLICDPAAGSGALLSTSIDVFNVSANQVVANDREPKLLELLSLRMGLKFYGTINHNNHPLILEKDIKELESSVFENVKIVVLNPPYVAGINSTKEKAAFNHAMLVNQGRECSLNIGQIGLEAIFLEYLLTLLKDGTIVSCLLPKQYLVSRGPEAIAFRKFLLNDFGLISILNYPGSSLFGSVTKDTCIMAGKVRTRSEKIKILSILESVQNVDSVSFEECVSKFDTSGDTFTSIMPGVEGLIKDRSLLISKMNDGWRFINSETLNAVDFFESNVLSNKLIERIGDETYHVSRGVVGSSGISDLLFLKRDSDFAISHHDDFLSLDIGIRNADTVKTLETKNGDSAFFNISKIKDTVSLNRIVDDYLLIPQKEGKQIKLNKTKEEIIKILTKEQKHITPKGCILIPRNLRVTGKVHLTSSDIFVSTNFIILDVSDKAKAKILADWMTTIFYQLSCEISSKDQEGTRKIEIVDFMNTIVPNISLLTKEETDNLAKINNTSFLELQNPIARPIDELWAKILFGTEQYKNILEEARHLLKFLANRRNSKK